MKKLFALTMLLAGCSSTVTYVWSGDRPAFKYIDWRCRLSAHTVAYIATTVPVYDWNLRVPIPVGITTFPVNTFDEEMYVRCMLAHNYKLEEVK